MDKALHAGYEQEIRDNRLAFSRGCAYTAIALIVLGAGLDYGLYPGKLFLFGEVRVGISLLIFVIILVMNTRWGERRAQMLTFIWLLLPQIMITWMIARTEGATSLYYGGLHLAIFASGIALPFSMIENIIFSALTLALYIGACSLHPESFRLQGASAVNTLFLLMSASISAVCTHFNERARFRLFRLKVEVAHKNTQLGETNKSLAEVKGQMLQQEKMAALGVLAAGLLHEVNNPVNFCLMAIDLAMEEPAAKSSALLAECLADAKGGMKRVQDIVSDLKIFAYRKPEAEASGQLFMFEKALNSAVRLTGHELHGVTVRRDALPEDNLVYGDEAAIIGVLINLLSNAALAMRQAATPTPAIHVSGQHKGERLFISVRDNGPGISPQNLTRVFEPFFTTREVGQGLGLGLSISYSVIERHGGTLIAESKPGEGTEMVFDLPHAHKRKTIMNELDQPAPTILYVDDEEMACKYFVRSVGPDYHVLTASGADAAIAMLHDAACRIGVVITDYRMPGRDGGALLRQIEQEFPHVVRILVTAFADKNLLLETVNSGEIFRILEKPLEAADVRRSLYQAVELLRMRDDRKSRFMAIDETLAFLAHELNTPLAAIANFARGVERRAATGDLSSQQQQEIEKIAVAMHDNARYCLTVLSTFVDSVRHIGTSTQGRPDATARQLIDSLLDTYPLTAAQRAMIEVNIIHDFRIATLPNCVSLVLSSILSNALRALRDTEEPKLRFIVSVDPRPMICITDNGPGIPADIMEHLLQDPVTTHAHAGGSGWGMIFCKRIMQTFGGGVRIQSEPGKSTCVNLDFPYIKNHVIRSDR